MSTTQTVKHLNNQTIIKMEFQKQKPIYLQIADRLMEQILNGEPAAEERMPSVRDVAASMGVNPNTVMRTFDFLQGEEIIYNRRGVGYYVATDAKKKILAEQRREFIEVELPLIRKKMQLLGIDCEDIIGKNQKPNPNICQ